MIIIVSENTDGSTTHVLQWIKKLGFQDKVIRINVEELVYLDIFDLDTNSIIIDVDGIKVDLSKEVSVIWFRRGNIPLSLKREGQVRKKLKLFKSDELNISVKDHLLAESFDFIEALNNPKTKIIGGYGKGSVNKLKVLQKAKELGLLIPRTVIVDSKLKLQNFFDENEQRIITKGISDTLSFENDRMGYIVYTNSISQEKIDELPNNFFPSLFQANIDKKIELRVFYWFGKVYALSIFSQLDDQTHTDFRIYNDKKPNRMVPYKLPIDIIEKIISLMDQIGLDTGSLDFIMDKNDQYYFLEVNPVGQFGMVSGPGNYFIEKQIAINLIEFENEFQKDKE
jgi:ATP-GRASP peptide maturase of grasp-with-spasm system